MRLTAVLLVSLLAGCRHQVVRDGTTYTIEIIAALARQEEAATALFAAASEAKLRGDLTACEQYAAPALLIESSAKPQAYRALWLAGLSYPDAEGRFPKQGTKQLDPGMPKPARAIEEVCGGGE